MPSGRLSNPACDRREAPAEKRFSCTYICNKFALLKGRLIAACLILFLPPNPSHPDTQSLFLKGTEHTPLTCTTLIACLNKLVRSLPHLQVSVSKNR